MIVKKMEGADSTMTIIPFDDCEEDGECSLNYDCYSL